MRKKLVMRLDLQGDREKKKVMKAASRVNGVDSIELDTKEMRMTVVGSVDPIDMVCKLRKHWPVEIFSVGPSEEPEVVDKKRETKEKENKVEKPNKEEHKNDEVAELIKAYKAYNPNYATHFYAQNEDTPNSCVIC